MLPQNFFRLDYFNIDKVNITDNSKMLQNELTKLAEKLYNKSNIYIDSNEIKEFIEKDIRVESAKVEKNSLGAFIIANSEEEVKEISEFLNEISDLAIFQKISQIYKVKDKEFVIILTDGVKIKTNRIKDSNDEINKEKENKRYIIAEQLYFNMSKERKIDYIDLRFNDYIIKYLGDSK